MRPLYGETDDEREKELHAAIDAFVLAGAIKLLCGEPAGLGSKVYRHHTMLVHETRP